MIDKSSSCGSGELIPDPRPILVSGASGYVGGRLVPLLLERGYKVRAMARAIRKLKYRPYSGHPNLEIVRADVLNPDSLLAAASGCRAAYYLVHSMNPATADFAKTDREAALNFSLAAAKAGLERIVYLGGLGKPGDKLSHHLRSRHECAEALATHGTPLTYFRAAMILGAGSASFEIMRHLVERLPVMLTPAWVRTKCQPIAARNMLHYLAACLEVPETLGQTLEIGGPDILTYEELFNIYAEEAQLKKRVVIPIPFVSPKISAFWVRLFTPVSASLISPLIEGLQNEVICSNNRAAELMPQKLLTCRETIRLALHRLNRHDVETCWSDAGFRTPPEWAVCGDAPYSSPQLLQCGYQIRLAGSPGEVWSAVESVGGETGWYFSDYLWKLRGLLDRLIGGVGLARGRRHPTQIRPGDALDFWRVLEAIKPSRLLLLAEMKAPGEAVLEFDIKPDSQGTTLKLLARFAPRGLAGYAYWYAVYPLHLLVFSGTLRGIAQSAGLRIIEEPRQFTPEAPSLCRKSEE